MIILFYTYFWSMGKIAFQLTFSKAFSRFMKARYEIGDLDLDCETIIYGGCKRDGIYFPLTYWLLGNED